MLAASDPNLPYLHPAFFPDENRKPDRRLFDSAMVMKIKDSTQGKKAYFDFVINNN